MNKKISAIILAGLLALSQSVSAASFTDMPQNTRTKTAIENAVKNGLLSGYEDNTVRPDANIRRSEMAAIITRACKVTKLGDISGFVDVSKSDWFYNAMAQAYEMGAFSGDGNKMNPNNNITFQECFTVLSQVFDLLPEYTVARVKPDTIPENTVFASNRLYNISVLNQFSDASEVADWAKPFVAGVVANGGWNGTDGKITPSAYITRAQFSIVMDNLIQTYIDEPGTFTELPNGNTMIRCDGVVLNKVSSSNDIYIGDSVSANKITIKDISARRLVVRGCATPTKGSDGKLTYGDTGITISGTFDAIRILRPYINADIQEALYKATYSAPNTNLVVSMQLKNAN